MSDRLLICGGREFIDEWAGFAFLDQLAHDRQIVIVIEGGARGADAIGRAWAEARGIDVITYFADWTGQGRKAGPLRNLQMLKDGKPTLVAALPGGRGTAHMVSIAREAGIQVIELAEPQRIEPNGVRHARKE
jgi:hypothetical protein